MKKATRIVILLLAIATLAAIFRPESQIAQSVKNTVTVEKAIDAVKDGDIMDTVKEVVKDTDAMWEVENAIEWLLDEVEDAVEGNAIAEWALDIAEEKIEWVLDDVEEALDWGENEESDTEVVEEVVISSNWYVEYNADDFSLALENGKKVAVFFHANRCGSCKALDADIAWKMDAIDSDTIIYKVDYDNSDELKRKYWVTGQHTVVYVDSDWEALDLVKWTTSLEEILAGFSN